MKKNPGRKERRIQERRNRRAKGKERAKLSETKKKGTEMRKIEHCPCCGIRTDNPETKEWKYCFKHQQLICMNCCVKCKYHTKNEMLGNCELLLFKNREKIKIEFNESKVNQAKEILKNRGI